MFFVVYGFGIRITNTAWLYFVMKVLLGYSERSYHIAPVILPYIRPQETGIRIVKKMDVFISA